MPIPKLGNVKYKVKNSGKRIEAGDELTYDYGEEYMDEYIKPMAVAVHRAGNILYYISLMVR